MKSRPLGQSGIQASAVALGAWAIGGWMWGGTEEKEAIAAIHAAVDEGITLIDTAPVYGFGRSEEIVGKAVSDRRDKVVLATKCGLVWDREQGDFHFYATPAGKSDTATEMPVYKYLGPDSIRSEVERSLQRLGVDHIDLYQTHWQDSTTPTADAMGALLELKKEGKIRAVGACNATVAHMEAYREVGPLDSDQERYSMLDRAREEDNLPYCEQNGVAFLAYSSLALGLLTGKITPERRFGEGDLRRDNPRFSPPNLSRVHAMLNELRPVAEKHSLTLAQLVIAWAIHQPGLTHALVGARSVQQAKENARAGRADLDEEDLAQIESVLGLHTPSIT